MIVSGVDEEAVTAILPSDLALKLAVAKATAVARGPHRGARHRVRLDSRTRRQARTASPPTARRRWLAGA
ncbi:hypothetical protein [Nonomuraea dietziae]|uniref:hypothetical protein n=1 Tax=Nonomuraea dietziae TaxID=65515 RepID=UPI0031D063CB